jgi:hypothetical protein
MSNRTNELGKQEKGGTRYPQRVVMGPSHRLGHKPIHMSVSIFMIVYE